MYVDNSVKRGDIFYADLSPVVGALVHNAGSVLVILNSALLLFWMPRKHAASERDRGEPPFA